MFYVVILLQSPPYDKKFNEKNRDMTLEMSLLVMCDTTIVCCVHVEIVVFTLVPGRCYRVFQCEGWKDVGSYSMDSIAVLLYYIL